MCSRLLVQNRLEAPIPMGLASATYVNLTTRPSRLTFVLKIHALMSIRLVRLRSVSSLLLLYFLP